LITSPLTGNCGNNLIIYLITRIVADKNGYEFGFNRHPSYDYHGGLEQLDYLNLSYGKEHTYGYHEIPDGITNVWYEQYQHINYSNGDSVDYHPYQPDIWNIPDFTKLYIRCCQDANYFSGYKEKIIDWLQYKQEFVEKIDDYLYTNKIFLDENLCILNARGGSEYRSMTSVLLQKKYWDDAIKIMLDRNPKMKFLCITDDPEFYRKFFDNKIPVMHISIGGDYFCVNNSYNLIISNSSFAIIPTYTNKNDPYVIAPFGWAKHNVTTGYFASSDIKTFGWNFLDREGNLS
jgi:hypothetical protein